MLCLFVLLTLLTSLHHSAILGPPGHQGPPGFGGGSKGRKGLVGPNGPPGPCKFFCFVFLLSMLHLK